MIKCAQAPLGGGKTFQTAKRAVENVDKGLTTLIFQPTHVAGDEVLGMIGKYDLKTSYATPLRGKSEATCLPEQQKKQCKRCPIFKSVIINEEARVALSKRAVALAAGKALGLDDLRQIASELKICPMLLTRLLAFAEVPKVVVVPYAYLATSAAMDIIEQIEVHEIIGDEGDRLFDDLVSSQQRYFTLARSRQTKASTLRERCNLDCNRCKFHYADSGDKGIKPFGGRIPTLDGISNIKNTVELIEEAVVDVEQGVVDGILKPLIDFAVIRMFTKELENIIPAVTNEMSPREVIAKIIEGNDKTKISFGERFDDLDNGQFAIPIPVGQVMQGATDIGELFDSDLPDEKMRVSQLLKEMFVDKEVNEEDLGRLKSSLKTLLSLVDFLQDADGMVYLIPERRGEHSLGFDSCSLSLRYLKTDHYDRVKTFLADRSRLMSGTMGTSSKMIGANLLAKPEEIEFSVAPVALHRSVLIVVHNCGEKHSPAVAFFPPWAAARLYLEVQKRVTDLRVLHFGTNTKDSTRAFDGFCDKVDVVKTFAIELTAKGSVSHDQGGAFEHYHERPAKLSVDKLRSSTSRAVNRNSFNLCAVIGNGVANWDSRLALAMAARQQGLGVSLNDFIVDEQVRSVTQALMRAPRGPERTVCFYAGNLHPLSFPEFLRNRIITTREIISTYLKAIDTDPMELGKIEFQIPLIADVIARFILGDEVSTIVDRPAPVDPSRVNWMGRADAYDGRMEHIKGCLTEKGFVDRVADKRGERPEWNAFLDLMLKQGVLKEEKRSRKIVLIDGNSKLSG